MPRDLFRTVADAGSGDSYEAALRAADALFSPRPTNVVRSAAPVDAADAADHAVAMAMDAALPPASTPQPSGPRPAGASEAGETTGRVLRALDEPAAEPPALPADEPTPKRRGRKPGSVNKPKLPQATKHGAEAFALSAAKPTGAPAANGHVALTSQAALLAADGALHGAAIDDARQGETALDETPGSAEPVERKTATVRSRRREPFAWVRTKLRPGEKWKRRLPKVAW